MIYLQTVISEFSARFVQTERANIVQLVSLLSYLLALVMSIRLVRMLQRGDPHFGLSLWRWCTGILFTVLFPNFLSMVLLRKPVSEVVLAAPMEVPRGEAIDEESGLIPDSRMQDLIIRASEEKSSQPADPLTRANYGENELGSTINNPDADPERYGEDLLTHPDE